MWQIVINGPGYFDTAYDLPEGVTTLGRADENDIVLSGDLVSRRHASLHVQGEQLRFEDLGSRNGSRINGQGLTGSRTLKVGDTVHVGENSLSVRQPQEGERIITEAAGGRSGLVQVGGKSDVRSAVILSKAVRESFVLRALDNVLPFQPQTGPEVPAPFTAEDTGRPPPLPSPSAPTREHSAIAPAAEAPRAAVPRGPGAPGAPGATPGYEALWLVSRVAQLLTSAPTLSAFLEQAVEWLMHDVNATTAVLLLSEAHGTLRPAVVRHRSMLAQGEVPVSSAIVNEALREGQALVVADVRDDTRFSSRESVVHYGASQVLCVPLGGTPPFAGALYLNRAASPGAATREALEPTLDLCTAISHLMATAVAKFSPEEAPEVRLRLALERSLPPELARRRGVEQGGVMTQLSEYPVSVLFADLAGFSGLAKRLPGDAVARMLQEFYQAVSQVVLSFEGTVVTFVGDSALTIFGAPYSKGDDAVRATRAALALRSEWQKTMLRHPAAEQCTVKAGIHTGKVLAGTVGTDRRLDYVAVGDPVNTAAWLVGVAGPDQILVTDRTLVGLGKRFETARVGEHTLGSRERLALYEVHSEDSRVNTNPGLR